MSIEMERRQFVQLGMAAAASLALPVFAAPGAADRSTVSTSVLLHDLAVPHAAHLAAALAGSAAVHGIHGDPSTVLEEVQRLRAQSGGAVHITGVTREAAPFCLQAMLGTDAQYLSMRRIDADLFVWTLQPVRA